MRDSDSYPARPVRKSRERDFSQRDEDDDDREPPARRSRGGNGPLILIVILGGAFFAVLVIGAFGFFSYRAATKARQAEEVQVMEEQRVLEIQRGPEAPAAPKAIPALPPPAGPTASLPTVILSNVRREKGPDGLDEILVDYEFTSGFPLLNKDYLVIKGPLSGYRNFASMTQRSGTIRSRPSFSGPPPDMPLEIWMERLSGIGPRTKGTKVSNSLTLDWTP